MKLSSREASGYFARPDADKTGLLIFGSDAMRVSLKRQQVVAALIGSKGEEEMRLTRIHASVLRKDPATLNDAIKAQGFFPGVRVALVEDVTDTSAKTITAALEDWQPGDAQVIVTAGSLTARSALRKFFEGHRNAYSVGIYDEPPSRDEIEAELKKAGLTAISGEVMADIVALSRAIDPGDFRQTVEKLALYKFGDETPVTSADVDAVVPLSTEAALDDVLNVVAEAKTQEIGPVLRKLQAQGLQPVGLCIGATRHFKALHAASSDPAGPSSGMSRLRPPVFGHRRDRMIKQAQLWGTRKLEAALSMLLETDLQLRSAAQTAPAMALVERTLIRLAMMGKR